MNRSSILASLGAGLLLAGGAANAATPTHLYGTSMKVYGETAAVATTPGTSSDDRSAYVVAAVVDETGGLAVRAWHPTIKKLVEVGHAQVQYPPTPPEAAITVEATAAAGLDSSHVATADVDNNGTLTLRTWTVGTGGISQLNAAPYPNPAHTRGSTMPVLGMVALSGTQVVTAFLDGNLNLALQAWTVGDTTAAPQTVGAPANGGPAVQVAIAAIDSSTVITAATVADGNSTDLQVTTWTVDSTGVYPEDQQTLEGVVQDALPGVAIGATTTVTLGSVGQFPQLVRQAFTPIINSPAGDLIEVIDWQISSTGAITEVGDWAPTIPPGGGDTYRASEVAGCMLPGGVPMTVYAGPPGPDSPPQYPKGETAITVGQVAAGETSEFNEVAGDNLSYLTATDAGDDFNVLRTPVEMTTYFITGAVTTPNGALSSGSMPNPGVLRLQVWSYPVPVPAPF